VAIALNLEADKAIRYHQQYYMLLGCTEFTRVYPWIKDNIWAYVNLVKLIQNVGIGNDEVLKLLKIANGCLPRVRLEYDRLREENSTLEAKVNSWNAQLNDIARTYQQFVDRNLALCKREGELKWNIDELEAKKTELEKTTAELQPHSAELQGNNAYYDNVNLEIEQEDVILTNDVFIPQSNIAINYHQNEDENEMYPEVEQSEGTLILDSRDIFRSQQK
jgi:hypothetical protein